MKTGRNFLKSFLLGILILCCLLSAATAEGILLVPQYALDKRMTVADEIAERLGVEVALGEDEDALIKQAIENPEMLLLETQSAIIRGLQGYQGGELSETMQPVARVDSEPLYLVMLKDKAAELEIGNGSDLLNYVAENEYELLLGRYIYACVKDMTATEICNQISIFSEYYYDEEIDEALHNDEIQLALNSESELPTRTEDLLVLATTGAERGSNAPEVPTLTELGVEVSQEINFWLLASKQAGQDRIAEWTEMLLNGDPIGNRVLTGEEAENEMQESAAAIEQYLTAEGLFFYRQ